MKPTLIFYGGTFDPIHMGHVESVRIAAESFPDAKITIVPGFAVPSTAGRVKASAASFADRVAMAVIAFDDSPNVVVSSIEEELPRPSYTVATLERLAAENPGARIAWMMGADQLESFASWKNPKRILELASLVVLPRPAMTNGEPLKLAQNLLSALGLGCQVDEAKNRIDVDGGQSIYILDRAPAAISSSEVRKRSSVFLNQIVGMVPDPVIEYISDLGLYEKI